MKIIVYRGPAVIHLYEARSNIRRGTVLLLKGQKQVREGGLPKIAHLQEIAGLDLTQARAVLEEVKLAEQLTPGWTTLTVGEF